jgi:hypothetical protein
MTMTKVCKKPSLGTPGGNFYAIHINDMPPLSAMKQSKMKENDDESKENKKTPALQNGDYDVCKEKLKMHQHACCQDQGPGTRAKPSHHCPNTTL